MYFTDEETKTRKEGKHSISALDLKLYVSLFEVITKKQLVKIRPGASQMPTMAGEEWAVGEGHTLLWGLGEGEPFVQGLLGHFNCFGLCFKGLGNQ